MDNTIFDFVIIGANFESLLLGNELTDAGKTVLVVEPSSTASFQTEYFFTNSNHPNLKTEPVVFEKGEFQQFVGFGENAPAYYEWVMPYLTPDKLSVAPHLQPKFKILTNSSISGLDAEENRIHSIVVNGKEKIMGYHFISTISPLKMLPTKNLQWSKTFSPKQIQRWSKLPLWSTLILDLSHSGRITDRNGIQLLRGNKNEFCLGFFGETKNNQQTSRWMTFVPSDEELNTELVGSLYREMKRLISKSYSECFQNLNFEKLTVVSESHGHVNFKMVQENPLSPFKNLWLCNTKLTGSFNLHEGSQLAVRELLNDYTAHGLLNKPSNISNLEPSATL